MLLLWPQRFQITSKLEEEVHSIMQNVGGYILVGQ